MFCHERLDVYRCSIRFLACSSQLLGALPRGNGALADPLRRASLSIPLNIAEGVGKTSEPDKRRHFAIARGSALECAAVLDACQVLGLGEVARIEEGKALLRRIASMLTRLCR